MQHMNAQKTIKVGYDSQTNLYTLKNDLGSSLEINGKSVVDPLRGFRHGELIVTSEKPESVTYKVSGRMLVGYKNSETGDTVSVEDYKLTLAAIDATRQWDDDSEEYTYDSLEAEVFALRVARTHTAVYENVDETHTVELEFIEYPVSAYSNITPLYSIDANSVFETKCKFTPNNSELFFDVCAAYGIDKSRIEIPTHSGLRYAKIDDKFVVGMEDFEKTSSGSIIGSYEECVARMNSNRKKLEDLVSMYIAKRSQKVLDKTTVGSLLIELSTIQNRVRNLDVKQKDYSSQRSLANQINELINTYKELA
jgi:hypothetical protein